MKKITLSLFLSILSVFTIKAVIACPEPNSVHQQDGTLLTIRLHGDEFLNYNTTLDGYTVIHSEKTGNWEYADIKGSLFVSSGIAAHNESERTISEKQFLKHIAPGIIPLPTEAQSEMRRIAYKSRSSENAHKLIGPKFDYSKFRGLVILVEFSDLSFSRDDAHDIFDAMINQPGYSGFYASDNSYDSYKKVEYTGSVYDYFSDNSGGKFKPQFDVVGPVKINKTCTSPNGTSSVSSVSTASLNVADPLVDYSLYDTDKDGVVDMVYFIFAGAGSNFSGNDSRYIWPHASQTYGTRDGVRLGRYACSTELYGPLRSKIIDGIGTIVHEFSHVLGVADLYDTDYSGSGGQSTHPGKWSVMASGGYNNNARTPVGYSAYERYANGFDAPEAISATGQYNLPYLGTTGKSYRIDSPIANEYFILENRQKYKWDSMLPGAGMLVFRVDSTNLNAWQYNRVNADPTHNYYELIRAMPDMNFSKVIVDSPGDPYPGSYRIKKIGNFTTWNGTSMPYTISKISEVTSSSGTLKDVQFSLDRDLNNVIFEDFENMPLCTNDTSGVKGSFTDWCLFGADIVNAAGNWASGSHSLGLVNSSEAITEAIDMPLKSISFEISTPEDYGSNNLSFKLSLRSESDEWKTIPTIDSVFSISLMRNNYTRVTYPLNNIKNAQFRFKLTSGSDNKYCYIDNIYIVRGEETSGIESINSERKANKLSVRNIGGKIIVEGSEPYVEMRLFPIDGRIIDCSAADHNGRTILRTSRRGVFIITDGFSSAKIVI